MLMRSAEATGLAIPTLRASSAFTLRALAAGESTRPSTRRSTASGPPARRSANFQEWRTKPAAQRHGHRASATGPRGDSSTSSAAVASPGPTIWRQKPRTKELRWHEERRSEAGARHRPGRCGRPRPRSLVVLIGPPAGDATSHGLDVAASANRHATWSLFVLEALGNAETRRSTNLQGRNAGPAPRLSGAALAHRSPRRVSRG